jgi:hypothetical protein
MGFYDSFWKVVERKHDETGMNYGDIFVSMKDLEEELTQAGNSVQPETPTESPEPYMRPVEDVVMPHVHVDPDAKFERRSVRPDQRFQEVSTESPQRESHRRNSSTNEENVQGGKTSRPGSQSRVLKKRKRKRGKRNKPTEVKMVLEKVVVNGRETVRFD